MDVRQSTRPAYNGVAKYATTSVAASIQPAAACFIHYDEKNNEWNLLQVKNRDNTENSSSSKIRDNTTIKKWFRTYSQRDATNWDNFPDEVSSKNLNEEDFRAFVKNYLAKII